MRHLPARRARHASLMDQKMVAIGVGRWGETRLGTQTTIQTT